MIHVPPLAMAGPEAVICKRKQEEAAQRAREQAEREIAAYEEAYVVGLWKVPRAEPPPPAQRSHMSGLPTPVCLE